MKPLKPINQLKALRRMHTNLQRAFLGILTISVLTLNAEAVEALVIGGFEHARNAAGERIELASESIFAPGISTTFTSGAGRFSHTQYDWGGTGGWTISNQTDNVTPGFSNQYAAIPGRGSNGSHNYAVGNAYDPLRIDFATPTLVESIAVTNTTYAYFSMADGDMFAKKFGGDSGLDADFLKLTIDGIRTDDTAAGRVEFLLADFRFADSTDDYLLSTWAYVALSSLGPVSALEFRMSGSDVGAFGLNTPAYFALDNLTTVPTPASWLLLGSAICAPLLRRPWRP